MNAEMDDEFTAINLYSNNSITLKFFVIVGVVLKLSASGCANVPWFLYKRNRGRQNDL